MITETTITGFTLFDPAGSPEFYRARKALQYSDSIDDYVRIMLDGNNGGYANDWLLGDNRSEEHTSELQSRFDLVCRLLLEKKNTKTIYHTLSQNGKHNVHT